MTWKKFSEEKPEVGSVIIARRPHQFGHDYYIGTIYGRNLKVDNLDGSSTDTFIVKDNDEWQEVQE